MCSVSSVSEITSEQYRHPLSIAEYPESARLPYGHVSSIAEFCWVIKPASSHFTTRQMPYWSTKRPSLLTPTRRQKATCRGHWNSVGASWQPHRRHRGMSAVTVIGKYLNIALRKQDKLNQRTVPYQTDRFSYPCRVFPNVRDKQTNRQAQTTMINLATPRLTVAVPRLLFHLF